MNIQARATSPFVHEHRYLIPHYFEREAQHTPYQGPLGLVRIESPQQLPQSHVVAGVLSPGDGAAQLVTEFQAVNVQVVFDTVLEQGLGVGVVPLQVGRARIWLSVLCAYCIGERARMACTPIMHKRHGTCMSGLRGQRISHKACCIATTSVHAFRRACLDTSRAGRLLLLDGSYKRNREAGYILPSPWYQ